MSLASLTSEAGSEDMVPKGDEGAGDKKGRRHHAKKQWKAAVMKIRHLLDPWEEFGFEEIKEETVIRHMYNPKNRTWKNDKIVVKIQPKV